MNKNLRIVFMGTPDFAVASLKALIENAQNIVGVVTATDKPAGRGQNIISSPVKTYAEKLKIENILQPENLKSDSFIEQLQLLKPDLFIVVAFRMLPEMVWSIPSKGTINLHASLLPDYRGAAPINWAIINGEKETGVTTFFIDKEIDTGKIIFQKSVPINENMNAGQLHDLLMEEGALLLIQTVLAISQDQHPSIPQVELIHHSILHKAPKIYKEDCKINWNTEGLEIYNFIRGLSPFPGAWTEIKNDKDILMLKIFEASFEKLSHQVKSGAIIEEMNTLKVAVNGGFIHIHNLQMAGRKRMNTSEFLKGFQIILNYQIVD